MSNLQTYTHTVIEQQPQISQCNDSAWTPHIVERPVPSVADKVLSGIHPLLRRLYLARGVLAEAELELRLDRLLPPNDLGGIAAAVDLLALALGCGQHIAIVGDYDADGATASALSILVLRALGGHNVEIMTPNRFITGYGLAPELVEQAAARGVELILTVDSGITSIAGVARARALGLQVIITDHHLPGDELPSANAIVNPNLPGDLFLGKDTAGVGVAFYLMAALRQRLQPSLDMAGFLDLVALGTVADLVPLGRNNRILVQQGLQRIRAGHCRPGIIALLQIAACPVERVTAQDLGFQVGPRLNAAGRLKTMDLGLACLLCDDPAQALEHAQVLNSLNLERRNIEAEMRSQAEVALDAITLTGELPLGLCLFDTRWHQGVIGILASRIKELYHRPAIALAVGDDEIVKGSARSIAGVHIRDILVDIDCRHPELLMRYGGHAMAAGLSLHRDKVEFFISAFAEAVHRYLHGQMPKAEILSDGQLSATEITADTARLLRYAGPWGQGFPVPVFDGEFRVRTQRRLKNVHLKLELEANDHSKPIDAIFFRWGEQALDAERIRIAYRLDLNEYRGRESPQLIIEHLEPV